MAPLIYNELFMSADERADVAAARAAADSAFEAAAAAGAVTEASQNQMMSVDIHDARQGPVIGVDIHAWTRGTLDSLRVSTEARGTGEPLGIPIDGHSLPYRPKGGNEDHDGGNENTSLPPRNVAFGPDHPAADGGSPPRRTPSRRDSMRRREALLKGKEGSRQRRRWENDHLLGVPNAQPPLPSDWEARPTHPVYDNLPYHVAQYWDRDSSMGTLCQHVNDTRAARAVKRRQQIVAQQAGLPGGASAATAKVAKGTKVPVGTVTRDLRAAAKKRPAVKLWVRALEQPVREFLEAQVEEERRRENPEPPVSPTRDENETPFYSDDEEEIVFVGRQRAVTTTRNKSTSAATAASAWKKAHREVEHQQIDAGLVFDALAGVDAPGSNDDGGSFKRWLTHSISEYYGLVSQSVTVGTPPRRVVYVTLGENRSMQRLLLPRPMWELF